MTDVRGWRWMIAAGALLGLVVLGGCGGSDDAAGAPGEGAIVVIDVRTPEEFASGHLEGAVNIDVQSPDFDARAGELDPAGTYVVYCRSGNRAATAVARMAELGIDDAVNAGSVEAAAEYTGLPIAD